MTTVLDSWAVLAYLADDEPAATLVDELLAKGRPAMCWINLGEVFYVLRRRHGEEAAASTVRDLREVLAATLPSSELVISAARLKAEHSIAYADAFAAATAIELDATLWTGDAELLITDAPWRWRDLR
ncbi:MAG TPA: PIN domain-containing protein [Acidimicrobiia bacterium]|nr:PIN domain-containing protein [Acidimicrobiia bacterium]